MRRLIQRWLTLEPIREWAEKRETARAIADTNRYLDAIAEHTLAAINELDELQRIHQLNEATSRAARSRRFDPQP